MATWEDGPEYAPTVRPDAFQAAPVPPLDAVPPAQQPAADAPKDRPQFSGPQAPMVPLAALVPVVGDQRNPESPFDVASSTVTSMDSAWGSAHWNPPGQGPALPAAPAVPGPAPAGPGLAAPSPVATPYPPGQLPATPAPWGSTPPPGTGSWGPPAAAPWPAPTTPIPPRNTPAPLPGGFPTPGTPQWFGPGPVVPQQPPPAPRLDARAVLNAATPGLCICLAIGGFIYLLAPVMLVVGFVLSSRVMVYQDRIRQVYATALGFLGLLALAGFMMGYFWFLDWWSFVGGWALTFCWILLVTIVVMVYRGLKSGAPRPPTSGYSSNWG